MKHTLDNSYKDNLICELQYLQNTLLESHLHLLLHAYSLPLLLLEESSWIPRHPDQISFSTLRRVQYLCMRCRLSTSWEVGMDSWAFVGFRMNMLCSLGVSIGPRLSWKPSFIWVSRYGSCWLDRWDWQLITKRRPLHPRLGGKRNNQATTLVNVWRASYSTQ